MARNSTETRERILTAARNLFSSHGYPGTALDDILTAAGITKGAFYHYFKSKEQICQILLDEAIAEVQHLLDILKPSENPIEQLQQWAQTMLNPEIGSLWMHSRFVLRMAGEMHLFHAPIPDKIRRFWAEQQTLVASLVSNRSTIQDPQEAARLILTVFTGSLWLSQHSVLPVNPDQVLEQSFDLILNSEKTSH